MAIVVEVAAVTTTSIQNDFSVSFYLHADVKSLLCKELGVANLETHILARAFLEARNVHWSVENASACVE
jgi:hypothetical protein